MFVHLSALATAESEKLRADAEEQLRKVVEEKVAQLKQAEAKLKQDVESIWSTFKAGVESIESASAKGRPARPRRTSGKHSDSAVNGLSASVRVKDFMPTAAPPPRTSVATSAPAVSALSASLATSSLHQAMGSRNGSTSQDEARPQSSSRSSTTRNASPSTASSQTLGMPINGEAEIREAYRRNMDESLDIATSFKYMMDIGAHVQNREPEVPATVPEEDETSDIPPSPSSPKIVPPHGRSPRAGKSAIKKPKPEVGTSGATTTSAKDSPKPEEGDKPAGEQTAPPTTPKSKRKVTFDVKPDVTIIASEKPKTNGGKRPKTEGKFTCFVIYT